MTEDCLAEAGGRGVPIFNFNTMVQERLVPEQVKGRGNEGKGRGKDRGSRGME